jgi:hypothetical protein
MGRGKTNVQVRHLRAGSYCKRGKTVWVRTNRCVFTLEARSMANLSFALAMGWINSNTSTNATGADLRAIKIINGPCASQKHKAHSQRGSATK